jgi:hypothetical protein
VAWVSPKDLVGDWVRRPKSVDPPASSEVAWRGRHRIFWQGPGEVPEKFTTCEIGHTCQAIL